MDDDVETEQLDEGLVVTETKDVRKIPGVVLRGINGRRLAFAIHILVDATRDVREFGNPGRDRWIVSEGKLYHKLTSP